MQKATKHKKILKIINAATLPKGFINDSRPMKKWWAEYKKEELELEGKKIFR